MRPPFGAPPGIDCVQPQQSFRGFRSSDPSFLFFGLRCLRIFAVSEASEGFRVGLQGSRVSGFGVGGLKVYDVFMGSWGLKGRVGTLQSLGEAVD